MKEITSEDLQSLLEKEKLSIIDVRDEASFATGHLKEAQNIPLEKLADVLLKLEKQKDYYIICKSGVRSVRACQFLEENGFSAINIRGGWDQYPR